jgi:hypothetical protein
MPGKLRVAIVAPSLLILAGQAVQADRLLRSWRHDPDIGAWLVPHNPLPPRFLRAALEIKHAYTWAAVRDQWIRVYRGVLGRGPESLISQPHATLPLGDRS